MDWNVAVMPKPEARKLPEGTMSEGIISGSAAPFSFLKAVKTVSHCS